MKQHSILNPILVERRGNAAPLHQNGVQVNFSFLEMVFLFRA
jgi:hypothetical protein